jgi:Tfp pilus assembly protein PilF
MLDGALADFQKTIKPEPKHNGAYYQLGPWYERKGEKEKAAELFR